jgi:putative cell wall-binding protein
MLDSVERPTAGWTFDVSSGIAYVAGQRDMAVFDCGHPAAIGTLPGYYLPERGWDVVAHYGCVYAACGLSSGVVHAVAPDAPPTFQTIAGIDRYTTAIASSQKAFPNGTYTVILASGANWPDALAGGALAGATSGSLLLTPATSLRSDVLAEIRRLGASKAYILGGTSAVSAGVEAALKTELGAAGVERIGGANRYETAELIGAEVGAVRSPSAWDHVAFVATGSGFADSVAASPISVATTRPLYLAGPAGLRAETLQAMEDAGVHWVIILGGPGAVSAAVKAQLDAAFGADEVKRLAGANRYETAVAIAVHGVDEIGFIWNGTALATGTDFPDALAGGVLQGRRGAPILLTDGRSLSTATDGAIRTRADEFGIVRYLGGTGAVNQHVRDQVAAILE